MTGYRRALVGDRARERQRVEKLLEDAQIKIGTVLTDIHGVSGRAMMEALIGGNRDRRSLARLAAGRAKRTTDLEEALRGFFTGPSTSCRRGKGDCPVVVIGFQALIDHPRQAAFEQRRALAGESPPSNRLR